MPGGGGGGRDNTYDEAAVDETYSADNAPTVPGRRPDPPARSAANNMPPEPASYVNPAFNGGGSKGGEVADYEYGDVLQTNIRPRLGSIANPSYEVPVVGGGGAGDGMEDYEYPDNMLVNPITGNAGIPPPRSGAAGAVDDGGTGVVYAVYASSGSVAGNAGEENYEVPVGDYAQPNGEYGRPSSEYGIPEEDAYYVEPAVSPPKPAPRPAPRQTIAPAAVTDDVGGANNPYYLEPAGPVTAGTTAGDTVYAVGDLQQPAQALATSTAGIRRQSTDSAEAAQAVGRPEHAVGWQDSNNAYLHARTASKRQVVYAVPMDSNA